MLAGVWFIYFGFGLTVAAMAPLVGRIVEDLGLSLAAMGGVLGAWPLVYVFTAIPAGAFVDRFGLRRSLLLAAVAIALSGVLRAAASDHLTLFLGVALFGVGSPLVSIGAPKLISHWFDGAERGMAMGIYITGPALGGVAALSLTNSVLMPLTDHSWRGVLLAYAAVSLLSGLAWLAITGHRASRAAERAGADAPRGSQLQVFARLLRVPVVRVVLLVSVGVFFFNHALNNWLPEILRSAGMDAVAAGYWASIPTIAGVAAALLIPRLAIGPRRIPMLLAMVGCAALATVLIRSSPGALLALGLVLQGVARSALMPISMLVLMHTRDVGARHMGAAGGLFFSAAEVGGVLGPLSVGYVADLSGGFSAALWMLTGVCALLAILALWLKAIAQPTG